MPITAREAEVLDWLARQYEPMVALLGELVNIDSGSYDRPGWPGPARSSAPIWRRTALPSS